MRRPAFLDRPPSELRLGRQPLPVRLPDDSRFNGPRRTLRARARAERALARVGFRDSEARRLGAGGKTPAPLLVFRVRNPHRARSHTPPRLAERPEIRPLRAGRRRNRPGRHTAFRALGAPSSVALLGHHSRSVKTWSDSSPFSRRTNPL